MPYEVTFTRPLSVVDRDAYINECYIGGDVVMDRLLPAVRRHFGDVQANQEDWGWFVWFTARRRRWGFFDAVVDTPELEDVRRLVEGELAGWTTTPCRVVRVDASYDPVETGAE